MTNAKPDVRPVIVADNRGRVSLSKHAGVTPGRMFLLDIDESTGVLRLTPATAVPASMLNPGE